MSPLDHPRSAGPAARSGADPRLSFGSRADPRPAVGRGAARSRRLALQVNMVKLLGLACLAPPATIGIAQRADLMLPPGEEAAAVALISSLGILCAAAGALILAYLADRHPDSPRWHWGLVLLASTVGLAGLLVLSGADSIWALGAGWMVGQAGFSGAMAILRTLLSFAEPVQRRRGAVMMVLFTYLGAFLPILVILIFPGSVWITTVAFAVLATAAPALLIRRADRRRPRNPEGPSPHAARADHDSGSDSGSGASNGPVSVAAPRRPAAVVPWPVLLLVHFLANALFGAYVTYHSLGIAERHGGTWGNDIVRLGMFVLAAALLALMLTTCVLLARPALLTHPARLIIIAGVVLAASVLLRAATDSMLLLVVALFGAGVAIGMNSSAVFTAVLESSRADHVGRRIGAYSACGLVGQLVGPPLALVVITLSADGQGYRTMFAALAIYPAIWTAATAFAIVRVRARSAIASPAH